MNLKQETSGIGVPITRIETISEGVIDPGRVRWVETDESTLLEFALRPGDILFSHINSPAHIGKTAIYNGLPKPLLHGINLLLLRPDTEQVCPRWLLWLLKSDGSRNYFRRLCKRAVNQASLNQQDIQRFTVKVPPLPEQERIVKLLDEADELRKLRAQADRRTAALLPALFHEMFGDPDSSRNNWPASPLGNHIDLLTGFPFKSEEYVDATVAVRLCRGANVLPQRIDWSDVRYWPADRANEVEQYKLCEGDVILAMDRPWISDGLKVARLTDADLPCFLVQRVARIRPKSTLNAEFVYQSLCHPSFGIHCNMVKTETTVPHISPHNIRSFIVPVPPLPLQQEFARRVVEIRELESGQAASRLRIENLFQSLLHRAFNEEL